MAFITLDPDKIKVGDPITKEILDNLKNNDDFLNAQVVALASTGAGITIFNGDVDFNGYSSLNSSIFYFKSTKDYTISDCRAQIFDKGAISSGSLIIEVEKATNTNNANFASVLTSNINFNFASDASYSEKVATISPSLGSLLTGYVLRIRVVSIPSGFTGKLLLVIGAQ